MEKNKSVKIKKFCDLANLSEHLWRAVVIPWCLWFTINNFLKYFLLNYLAQFDEHYQRCFFHKAQSLATMETLGEKIKLKTFSQTARLRAYYLVCSIS